MMLQIFTDGGARGNPGPGAVGVVVKDQSGKIINRVSRPIGEVTNNVAEYKAVMEALESVARIAESGKIEKIEFFLDSTLVVNQLNGIFKIKDGNLRNLLVKIRELEGEVGGNVSYSHIPREKNWEADLLVNQALDSK